MLQTESFLILFVDVFLLCVKWKGFFLFFVFTKSNEWSLTIFSAKIIKIYSVFVSFQRRLKAKKYLLCKKTFMLWKIKDINFHGGKKYIYLNIKNNISTNHLSSGQKMQDYFNLLFSDLQNYLNMLVTDKIEKWNFQVLNKFTGIWIMCVCVCV